MSSLEAIDAGRMSLGDEGAYMQVWRQRHANASRDRRRYEPIWQLCQSFIQNRQWVGWDYQERRIVDLPNADDRERVTVNVLTQYLWTIVGKLTADDFRPDVTFRRGDVDSQAYARQAQRALEFAWDEELDADEEILDAIVKMCTFGTAGLRVKPDPGYGKVVGEYPIGEDGAPMFGDDRHAYVAELAARGQQAELETFREGRLCLEGLSPFNLLPPPGIEKAKDFPWMLFERPVALDTLATYYPAAQALTEERIRAIDMIGVRESTSPENGPVDASGDLKGHVLLKTGYSMPTRQNPMGETFVWAKDTPLHYEPKLPFVVGGMGKIGWVPLHFHKVPGRFWAMGVVEPGLGPQRQRNRSRSQYIEMKDRAGLGRVYAHKGVITEVNKPKGGIFELVEVLPGHELPKETAGVGPGPWIGDDLAMSKQDMDEVMGLREVSLGSAPAGVSAYSAFALLAEQDDRRVGPVLKQLRFEIAKLAKVVLNGMRTYWLPDKHIAVAGESEMHDVFVFNASKLPEDCYVQIGKGAPLPQSQAAEVQKIFDVFDRAIASGQVLPLDWLYESLSAGKAQPLPKREMQVQQRVAQFENMLIRMGQQVMPAPFDNDEIHAREHRQAQQEAQAVPGMEQYIMALEMHIQQHLQNAAMKAVQAGPQQGSAPGGTPQKPGGGPQGNGRDAGFGQQMMAANRGMLPQSGGDATVPMQ